MTNHGQPWSIMLIRGKTFESDKASLNIKNNYGLALHSHKHCLDVKIVHAQVWWTIVQRCNVLISKSSMLNHVYFRFYNICFRVYIPWV